MKIVADENIPLVREAFERIGQVVTVPGREMSAGLLADADVLLVRSVTPVGPELLAEGSVRFVATATIGTDHLDTRFLKQRSIGWSSAAGGNANSVAEYVVAALLSLAGRHSFGLSGKTLGVVGVGNIGSRVVRYAEALGMTVVQNDPPLQRQTGEERFRPIAEILGCDFITLHVPLTRRGPDATWHMANAAFLAQMKGDAYLINTSRGPVVRGEHLLASLESARIAGAVLDVWQGEPNIDVQLLERVSLGTAHIAGYSFDGKVNGTKMIFDATCQHFGLPIGWDPAPLMPTPAQGHLEIDARGDDCQAIVGATVRQIYDIERDDAALRRLIDQPVGKRASCFDSLRREYPVRREFGNTELAVSPPDAAPAGVLRDLGFRLASVG